MYEAIPKNGQRERIKNVITIPPKQTQIILNLILIADIFFPTKKLKQIRLTIKTGEENISPKTRNTHMFSMLEL